MRYRAWTDVALFALSQRPLWCALLAATLLLFWWNMADYYVYQTLPYWPMLDETLTVPIASLLFLSVLVLVTRSQIRGGLKTFTELEFNVTDTTRPMLAVIAENCRGLSREYVNWLCSRPQRWWAWLPSLWYPALTIFLAVPLLHSGLMEYVAAFSAKTPPSLFVRTLPKAQDEIFLVEHQMVLYPNDPPAVVGIAPQGGKVEIPKEAKTAGAFKTTLDFLVGDYPHVHRRIEIWGCRKPNCEPGNGLQRDPISLLVQTGEGRFEYRQRNILAPLNARAVLRTLFGGELSSVSIY